jgi:hypothetical protein
LISAAMLVVSVLALSSIATGANAQGAGFSVTVSHINGTPTTITYATSTNQLVPAVPTPGFTVESIVIGLVIGILALLLVRRRRHSFPLVPIG